MGEFGDKFRKAREKKELSLDDVSNVTKISSRMLQAIEEEHFDRLPGGVFNKGFIRAYAKHLGLNDEEAVTDYLACLRQAQIDAHEVWQPERPGQTRPAAPEKTSLVDRKQPERNQPQFNKPGFNKPGFNKPGFNKPEFNKPVKSHSPAPVEELPDLQLPRAEDVRPRRRNFGERSTLDIPWRILALAAVVVVLGVILWTRRSHSTNTAAASTPPAKTVQTTTEPATVTGATTAPVPVPARAPKNQSSPAPNSGPTSPRSSTPKSSSPQASAATPATAPAADPNNSDNDNDVTVRTLSKSNPNLSEKSTAPLTLVIRATETSWISVLADGQTVSQETLIAPAHTSVRASREIIAKIGNAAGVTFLWNGQEIPADGAEAEVKTFVFDSTGMRVVPPTPPPAQNQ